jgi:hypothetical protein
MDVGRVPPCACASSELGFAFGSPPAYEATSVASRLAVNDVDPSAVAEPLPQPFFSQHMASILLPSRSRTNAA